MVNIWCKDLMIVKFIIDHSNSLTQRWGSRSCQTGQSARIALPSHPVMCFTVSSGYFKHDYVARSWSHDCAPGNITLTKAKVSYKEGLFCPTAISLQTWAAEDQKYQLGCMAVSLWLRVLSRSLSSRHSTVRGYLWSSNLLANRLCEFISHFKSPLP